jgi:hypothetical protein
MIYMAAILWREREFDARCRMIDATQSGITDEDAVSLGEIMKAGDLMCLETLWLVSLSVLKLCRLRNMLRGSCVQGVFDVLAVEQPCRRYRRLRFRGRIESDEKFALTCVLKQCNKVGDAGALGLCEGLKVNRSLQKLYLVSSACP